MCFDNVELVSREYGKIICTPLHKDVSTPVLAFEASGPYGTMVHHEVREATYSLWYSRYILREDMHLLVTSANPALSLNFVLKSDIDCYLRGLPEGILNISGQAMQEQQYNMIYLPSINCEYAFRKNEEYALFGIQFDLIYLKRWGNLYPELKAFLIRAKNNIPAVISPSHPSATPEMVAVILDILHYMSVGPLRIIRLEARMLELLEMAFERISTKNFPSESTQLSGIDQVKIQRVQEFLLQHLDNPGTLKTLAREVGTNLLKLKEGFKSIYGITVFAFLREARMQKAKSLLLESGISINEIATAVGYKHHAHFTAAFKRRFGHSPKDFRNRSSPTG